MWLCEGVKLMRCSMSRAFFILKKDLLFNHFYPSDFFFSPRKQFPAAIQRHATYEASSKDLRDEAKHDKAEAVLWTWKILLQNKQTIGICLNADLLLSDGAVWRDAGPGRSHASGDWSYNRCNGQDYPCHWSAPRLPTRHRWPQPGGQQWIQSSVYYSILYIALPAICLCPCLFVHVIFTLHLANQRGKQIFWFRCH